jgi:hypothetical protein
MIFNVFVILLLLLILLIISGLTIIMIALRLEQIKIVNGILILLRHIKE